MESVPVGTPTRIVSWTEPTAVDDSGILPTRTATHQPGDRFDVGMTAVTYTFSDRSGNSAECSFIVTISEFSTCEQLNPYRVLKLKRV